MEQCKNRIGERCKLDGAICKHLVYDGKCPRAELDSVGKVSFRTALKIVLEHKCSPKRKQIYKRGFNVIIEYCGFKWDDPVEDFTYEVAEELVSKLEQKYKPHTIAGWLESIYFSGNIAFRTYYKENGLKRPLFERLPYRVRRGDKPKMQWEQKTAIKYEMERLRRMALDNNICNRKRLQAKNYFIALWWGWWFGTRPGDINNMKWGNIININGIWHIKYKPHKTEHSSNCTVCWPIPSDAYNQIYKFIGKDDEFCLVNEEKFVPKHHPIGDTKVKNQHTYQWKTINRFFRSIGINGWAAFYSLRYMNSQDTYKKYGSAAESEKLGHTEFIGRRSYYDMNDHSIS